MHQDIETGGDLFGRWNHDGSVSVNLVTGPGANVRRTGTAFFQDAAYLKQVGAFALGTLGLTQIGQWHSHHKLPIKDPSQGDCDTVRTTYFPENPAINNILMIIVNIKQIDGKLEAGISPYIFARSHTLPILVNSVVDELQHIYITPEEIKTHIAPGAEAYTEVTATGLPVGFQCTKWTKTDTGLLFLRTFANTVSTAINLSTALTQEDPGALRVYEQESKETRATISFPRGPAGRTCTIRLPKVQGRFTSIEFMENSPVDLAKMFIKTYNDMLSIKV